MVAPPIHALLAMLLAMPADLEESGRPADDAVTSSHHASQALRHRKTNAVVKMALLEAHRRLENPRCREIFTDFRDLAGTPLQQNLDSVGQTAQSYLTWMLFSNAESNRRCEERGVLAFTSPGSRVVYFCSGRFQRRLREGGLGSLAVLILHEELHSLGLGENPPTPDEISKSIESRCGT